MTIKQLIMSTFKDRKLDFTGVKMSKMELFPQSQIDKLFVSGVSVGTDTYIVSLLLQSVKSTPSKDCKKKEIRIVRDKVSYCVTPAIYDKTPVQVRCTCMDFIHRWAYFNKKHKALYGGPFPKYKRKTPPPSKGGYPRVNPLGLPGICKHLYKLIDSLIRKGVIKEGQ